MLRVYRIGVYRENTSSSSYLSEDWTMVVCVRKDWAWNFHLKMLSFLLKLKKKNQTLNQKSQKFVQPWHINKLVEKNVHFECPKVTLSG